MTSICTAGHDMVKFWCRRCPVCEAIERLDKQLLKADVENARLRERIGWLEAGFEAVDRNWNGGAC